MYSDIELDTEVMGASPHRLVQMLIDKCLQRIQLAKTAIENKDIKQRHYAISKASETVDYLRLCLNFEDEKARELSQQLDNVYVILQTCLLHATLENNIAYLNTGIIVISNIKEAWDKIAPKT